MTCFTIFREGMSRSRKNSGEAAISVFELFPVVALDITITATLSLHKKKEAKCETDKDGRRLGSEIR